MLQVAGEVHETRGSADPGLEAFSTEEREHVDLGSFLHPERSAESYWDG